jgi:type VI secretion system protein ImpM
MRSNSSAARPDGDVTPGFFGKVRSHGDFVSRRLPPEMALPFDAWAQAWLAQSRRVLGADWLATWSTSPLWRFVLAPGLCGAQAWTGVMMPSADRVGRYFPLILALSLERAPALRACLYDDDAWYAHLEMLALTSLADGFSLHAFDMALQALGGGPRPVHQAGLSLQPGRAVVTALAGAVIPRLADAGLAGNSAWWTEGAPGIAPCLAVCAGLPDAAAMTALLDGRWQEYGWRVA